MREIPGMTPAKAQMLQHHWQALDASPDRSDLTRLEGAHEIALKHYLDSAMPLKFMKLPSPLLDIGSGAGFPGLVLKILSPETRVILGENRPKRVEFMQQIIKDLQLTDVEVFAHRIGPNFPLEINGVVTRALESARDTLYRVQPFLPEGGRVILLKGPRGIDEISEAVAELQDFTHSKTYAFNLNGTSHERQIVVYERRVESIRKNENRRVGSIEITSRANDRFKALLSLTEARGIQKQKQFLVSGQKLVDELASSPQLMAIIASSEHTPVAGGKMITLAPVLFRELDVLGTKSPLALMALAEPRHWNPEDTHEGITVFLPFQDPANIGSAIRSAAAFGVNRVVLLKEAASPYLPKAVRAAANAIFGIELLLGPSLAQLVQMPLDIYRLDLHGENLRSIKIQSPFLLLAGVEGYGFKSTGNSKPVSIEVSKNVESLNAQTALAIALYELSHKIASGS